MDDAEIVFDGLNLKGGSIMQLQGVKNKQSLGIFDHWDIYNEKIFA